ncbi:MAG: NADH-quinone oxidoreductase subunit NuoE [Lachnospiraceae bacterium]|nr:NADH-quinone oxidoreductase subunit NuoE [Lachnospiraceae bacterium]
MCNNCAETSQYWDSFEAILANWNGEDSQLIPILQQLQESYGYLPEDVIERLAKRTGIFASKIIGVATFYSQFRLEPVGKHIIKVCFGTACHVNGAENIADALCHELGIKIGGTTEDKAFTIESVACIGCCSLAPVIMIDDETHGRLTPETARTAIRAFRAKEA